jgi:hypothetical protein
VVRATKRHVVLRYKDPAHPSAPPVTHTVPRSLLQIRRTPPAHARRPEPLSPPRRPERHLTKSGDMPHSLAGHMPDTSAVVLEVPDPEPPTTRHAAPTSEQHAVRHAQPPAHQVAPHRLPYCLAVPQAQAAQRGSPPLRGRPLEGE